MKKIFRALFSAIIVLFMLCLVLFPDRYVQSTFDGISLWAFNVLPSLLPFFFLTTLLTSTGSLEKLSKISNKFCRAAYKTSGVSAYVHIMSLLSGYPVGAKIIADLYEKNIISSDEATRMSTFCSTSGPLFIVGSVGIAMFKSKTIGLIFLAVHILSSIFCGICFRNYGDNRAIGGFLRKSETHDNILYDCVFQSVISVLIVGGFVAVFYTLSQILHDFKILLIFEKPLSLIIGENRSIGFVQGIIECTKGCKILSLSPSKLSCSLACSLISFGGISVICQSVVFLKKANVNIKIFISSKILQMIFSFLTCFLAVNFLVF